MRRILGDLRIFQSVFNDLKIAHDPKKSTYRYYGTDPYELEDDHFPTTVAAVEAYARDKVIAELEAILAESSGGGSWRRNIINRIETLKGIQDEPRKQHRG